MIFELICLSDAVATNDKSKDSNSLDENVTNQVEGETPTENVFQLNIKLPHAPHNTSIICSPHE